MQKQTDRTDTMNLDNQTLLCGTSDTTLSFQRVTNTAPMSEATRSVVHDNVLQFKAHNKAQEQPGQEGITALYERLSNDDDQSKVYKEMFIVTCPQTCSKS